jgi:ribokinase
VHSENTIVVVPGSNGALSPDDVSEVELNPGNVVLSQFEIPQETILSLFKRAKKVGAITILNPAPAAMSVQVMGASPSMPKQDDDVRFLSTI